MNQQQSKVESAQRSGGTLFGHPPGLFVLFGVEMWERFSFYGMRAILPLYLAAPILVAATQPADYGSGRAWSKGDASILMGWYGGMCYLLPIIGGILADRLIGTHLSMLIGGLLIALGHVVLGLTGIGELTTSATGLSAFIGGLALIAIGTGYFKPCVSVMVGQLYQQGDPRKDSAFAIFYMGINVGAFLGQTFCGLLAKTWGWHYGFGCAAFGMLAGLIMYVLMRPAFLGHVGRAPRQTGAGGIAALLMVVGLALAASFGALYHVGGLTSVQNTLAAFQSSNPAIGRAIQIAVVLGIVIAAVFFCITQRLGDRGPTACIFIFMMFNAVFWLGFEQAATSLNFFGANQTDLTLGGLFGKWEMPAAWLQNVNPFLVIVLSPLFAILWSYLARSNLNMSQSVKIAIGLVFLGLGYLFVTVGAYYAATGVKVAAFWLIATYFWHTVGELFISPTGLSFVTKAAPVRFVSLLMGIWFVSSFVAHLAGGYIASTVEDIESGKTALPWYPWFKLGGQADYYLMFVVASIGAGLVILILTPLMKRMLHGRG